MNHHTHLPEASQSSGTLHSAQATSFSTAAARAAELEQSYAQSLTGTVDCLPLYRSKQPPKPYPVHALGPLLGEAVDVLSQTVQAADAICAHSVLSAAALVCQGLANVGFDQRVYPLSLYFVTIARSGERKSGVDRVVLQAIRSRQEELLKGFSHQKIWYDTQMKIWERQQEQGSGKEEPPIKPRRPILLASEPTMEGLIHQFRDGLPSMGLFSDEAGGFLGGYANRDERRLHGTAFLCKLWDGDPIDRIRCEQGFVLNGCRLSMHLMGQEWLLSKMIQDPLLEQVGLMSRVLVAYPPSRMGTRKYKSASAGQTAAMQRFSRRILELLDGWSAPSAQQAFRLLTLSSEGSSLWVSYHDENEKRLQDSSAFQEISRFVAKAPEHVLRVAGVLALVEDPMVQEIGREVLVNAVQLIEWYVSESLRLQSTICVDQELQVAEKLLEWLRQRGQMYVWVGEIYRLGPSAFRRAEDARRALHLLEDHGWVKRAEGRLVNGVERKEVWRILLPLSGSGVVEES